MSAKKILYALRKAQRLSILAFTNGTLIDEDFADEMLRVKNFVPAISIEGFEEAPIPPRRGYLSGGHPRLGDSQKEKAGLGVPLLYAL